MQTTANLGLKKPDGTDVVNVQDFNDNADLLDIALDTKAPLASPALKGMPTAPTAVVDTSTTQVATTAFVLGQAGTTAPTMNGVEGVGISKRYARADHVHPVDTSRAAQMDFAAHLADYVQLHAQWDAKDLTLQSGVLTDDVLCWLGKSVKYAQGSLPATVSLGRVSTTKLRYGKFSAAFRIKSNCMHAAPTTAPTLSVATNASSTLANTTYYAKYTWVYANGEETGASPEKSLALGATGRNLVVTVPALPVGAIATNIYIGTATGVETYQGQTITASYVQSAALNTSSASCPVSGDFTVATLKVSDASDGNVVQMTIKNTDIMDTAGYQVFYGPFENKGQFANNEIKFSLTCEAHNALEISLDSIVVEPVHVGSYTRVV